MSFWGLSQTGKNARGQLGELPAWGKDAMVRQAERRNNQWATGDSQLNDYQAFLRKRMETGFGTPDQIRQWGQAAMPGVAGAMERTRAAYGGVPNAQTVYGDVNRNLDTMKEQTDLQTNQANQINLANFMRSAGRVDENQNANRDLIYGAYGPMMEETNTIYGGLRKGNDALYDRLQAGSDATYDDLLSKNASAYGALRGQNKDVYGGLRRDNADTFGRLERENAGVYGDLRRQNADVYGDIIGKTGNAYTDARTNLERMLPSGDLLAATTARAFAPNFAATNRRLRAAGIDPNSPEASGMLQSVETSRARAMDDILGKNMADYVRQQNELGIGGAEATGALRREQFGNESGLARDEFGNRADFGQRRLGNESALGREEFGNESNFARQQFGNESDLSQRKFGNTAQFGRERFGNESDLAQQWGSVIRGLRSGQSKDLQGLNDRSMAARLGLDESFGTQDLRNSDTNYMRSMAIMDQRNQAIQQLRAMGIQDADIQRMLEQMGLNLENQQFDMGLKGLGLNIEQENIGGQGLGNLGQFYINQGNANDAATRAWSDQAAQQYLQDLGIESQNAGWGTKLLSGMAPGLLSLIPGVGPMLSSIVGGAMGGMGSGAGGFGGGGYGGYGATPPFLETQGGFSSFIHNLKNTFNPQVRNASPWAVQQALNVSPGFGDSWNGGSW